MLGWHYVAQPALLVGHSMHPTLQSGDRVLVFKLVETAVGSWGRKLRRQDIVQCRNPGAPQHLLIKRLIGLPGDRLTIRDRRVFINDVVLDEPYKRHDSRWMDQSDAVFPDETRNVLAPTAFTMFDTWVRDGYLVVPPEHYFVLGDNRSTSQDSRLFGMVASDDILGVVVLVAWSFDSYQCQRTSDAGGCAFRSFRSARILLDPTR
ncbi:MAG: signal peptidase I [Luteitalea sp.]|nr:signal peptidase I [Luteitalea sp.]